MKIVIDISDKLYNRVQNTQIIDIFHKYDSDILNTFICIQSGTVVPKGHGDLIDRKELLSHTKCTYKYDCPSGSSCDKCSDNCVEVRDIENAPIVIEADKDDNHE